MATKHQNQPTEMHDALDIVKTVSLIISFMRQTKDQERNVLLAMVVFNVVSILQKSRD